MTALINFKQNLQIKFCKLQVVLFKNICQLKQINTQEIYGGMVLARKLVMRPKTRDSYCNEQSKLSL